MMDLLINLIISQVKHTLKHHITLHRYMVILSITNEK